MKYPYLLMLFILKIRVPIKKRYDHIVLFVLTLYRRNDNWLRYRAEKLLKQRNPELCDSLWKKTLNTTSFYVFDRKQWWLIILLVIATYLFGTQLNIDQLNLIDLKVESAKSIVDQRTSNTATIISMTLAVVGFLMSNLAVKESYAYRLLFKHSKLYSIIYFTLSTIASLIIISTLRDHISSEYLYARLVIIGTYLVLIVLILIGYLFGTIIHFTNSQKIQSFLQDELESEAKAILKSQLVIKYSEEEYEKLLSSYNAKEFSLFDAFDFSTEIQTEGIVEEEAFPMQEERLLKDINIAKLSKYLVKKKKEGRIFYRPIKINSFTAETDDFLWINERENTIEEKKLLRHSIYLVRSKSKEETMIFNAKKYFSQTLEQSAEEGKVKGIESVLNGYLKLYELEMKNLKNAI